MREVLITALLLAADDTKPPITTDNGDIGKLLKKWHAEGTAAGNVGDWYDNRDGEHSPLDLRPWPQLKKVQYTPDDLKSRRNWAAQRELLKHVTFGNSSTSAPPTQGGSNPMMYYTQPFGLAFLEQQYLKNNAYIYPEHRDHDPGHNGLGDGYGDLYPTNTPYLYISQGSSGSDQPFMRALPFTLAAFRPEVKKILVEKGLLMPTIQRVFRASNKNIAKPEEYFTGKAHPTVFEGSNVDTLKMVQMAHDITKDTIPPLVKLKVLEEDAAENGRDYFEAPGRTEKLGDTSSAIARIWRGKSNTRRMVVSAKDSLDVNGKKLMFRWVLLRGDPERVKITAKEDQAEIVVRYHERRPIAPGARLESNRVDIGVFAESGAAVSAPAFITWVTLDSELRAGPHILYGAGVSHAAVTSWEKAMAALAKDSPASKALEFTEAEREALAAIAREAGALEAKLALARKRLQEKQKEQAAARSVKDDKLAATLQVEVNKAQGEVKSAQAELDRALDVKAEGLKASPRAFVQAKLDAALKDRYLHTRLAKDLPASARVTEARKKLLALVPIREGKDGWEYPKEQGYEVSPMGEYNAAVLAELLLPGAVRATFTPNYVDARLASRRTWLDTHAEDGSWVRRQPGSEPAHFTPEGWLVETRDDRGRPLTARTVAYTQPPFKPAMWHSPPPLTWAPGPERITFSYESGKREVKSREKL